MPVVEASGADGRQLNSRAGIHPTRRTRKGVCHVSLFYESGTGVGIILGAVGYDILSVMCPYNSYIFNMKVTLQSLNMHILCKYCLYTFSVL